MRKTYSARLADLRVTLMGIPAESHGHHLRAFLIHEANTSRNLRKANLLNPEFCSFISTLPFTHLSGSTPYFPHYVLSTITSIENTMFTVSIYDLKKSKSIYWQEKII
jgi:hypothetical protein